MLVREVLGVFRKVCLRNQRLKREREKKKKLLASDVGYI